MTLTDRGVQLDARYGAHPGAIAEIRHDVAAVAERLNAGETALLRINLAVSEAVTNAVLHAYPDRSSAGDVHVRVTHAEGGLEVRIRDSGVGISRRDDRRSGGLGLGLMAHEAAHCEIKTGAEGTEVLLRFGLAE